MSDNNKISIAFSSSRTLVSLKDEITTSILGFERSFKLPLDYFLSKNGKPTKIKDREEWLTSHCENSELFSICNNVENDFAKFDITVLPNFEIGEYSHLSQKMHLKHLENGDLFSFFKETASRVDAFEANAGLPVLIGSIHDQKIFDSEEKPSPLGLPSILPHGRETYTLAELPQFVTWVNFWSKDMLSNLDYDKEKHDGLFYRVEHMESGSVFQLTAEITNPENPKQLSKLLSIYDAFPKIGGRHLIKNMA